MDDRNRRTDRVTLVEGFVVGGKSFGKFAQRLRHIGGGPGRTDQAPKTYPRLAIVIGHIDVDKLFTAIDAVMSVQRDDGDRLDRLHAWFKYTIDDKGLDWIQAKIGRRLGFALEPAQPYSLTSNGDPLGWIRGDGGRGHCTLFIQNARVINTPAPR